MELIRKVSSIFIVVLVTGLFSMQVVSVTEAGNTTNTWHKKLKLMGLQKEVVVESGRKSTINLEITRKKYAKKRLSFVSHA